MTPPLGDPAVKRRVFRHEEEIVLLANVLSQFMLDFAPILCYSQVPSAPEKLRSYREQLAQILYEEREIDGDENRSSGSNPRR